MDKLALTVLMENSTSRPRMAVENGLSILLRRGERSMLFDCGDSGSFIDNAAELGEDLGGVGAVALSHDHYDHTRGFLRFSREFKQPYTLYLSRRFFKTCFWDDELEPGLLKPTLGPLTPQRLSEDFVNWRLVSDRVLELPEFPGAFLVSGFQRTVPFEAADPTNVTGISGENGTDLYLDEQALAVKTDGGLLLLTGCSHAGVLNIINTVRELFDEPIAALIGGTHLIAADETRTALTADALAGSGIPSIYVCHCTGPAGFEACGERGLRRIRCGDRLEF